VAPIPFFFGMGPRKSEALDLAAAVEAAGYTDLIPAFYRAEVARQAPPAEQRPRRCQKAPQRAASWPARAGPVPQGSEEERAVIEAVAQEGAHLVQRSSSWVEGRNGQLAWRHPHLPCLRPRKLKALTGVHN
jgi:hypothetical protein